MLNDPRSAGLQIRIYALYCFVKNLLAATILMFAANQMKSTVESYQSNYDNCDMCLKQAEHNPNILYEFALCAYFYPANKAMRRNIFLTPSFNDNFPIIPGLHIEKSAENMTSEEFDAFQIYLGNWSKSHPNFIHEQSIVTSTVLKADTTHDNLLLHRGLFEFKVQSQVNSLTSIAVVLFFVVLVYSLFYLWLACFFISDDLNDRNYILSLFMAINLVVIVLLLQLANNIWMLHFSNGCWVSVVGKPFIIVSHLLMVTFMVSMCLAQCPISCNILLIFFCGLILLSYTILSVIMAVKNYAVAHRLFILVFVLLGFLSIFEIPSFIFGLAFYKDAFRFISVPLCNFRLPHIHRYRRVIGQE